MFATIVYDKFLVFNRQDLQDSCFFFVRCPYVYLY
nr:MAG TPA: hypothetical protein [Caudoviricetes sp.]DAM62476.1 MAG TPA: hypothetical protein [Caudoviricetes sp.]